MSDLGLYKWYYGGTMSDTNVHGPEPLSSRHVTDLESHVSNQLTGKIWPEFWSVEGGSRGRLIEFVVRNEVFWKQVDFKSRD